MPCRLKGLCIAFCLPKASINEFILPFFFSLIEDFYQLNRKDFRAFWS